MRFQNAAPDGRAVVYAGIQADPLVSRAAALMADATTGQRLLARAVMNGQSTDPASWRTMFPSLFEAADPVARERSEGILQASLAVADRGEQARSQFRGAIVESVTERLLERRAPGVVRRERRILFDGVAAEIHPYDVTVEATDAPEAYDCKWGARGIDPAVLHQLAAARGNAAGEGVPLIVALVVFDARRSCLVRLARQTAPTREIRLVSIETLRSLARVPPDRLGNPAGSQA